MSIRSLAVAALLLACAETPAEDPAADAAGPPDPGTMRVGEVDMTAAPPDMADSDNALFPDAAPGADAFIADPDAGAPDAAIRPPPDPGHPLDPPEMPAYSGGECPLLGGGPTDASALVQDFRSGDTTRSFRLVVPEHYDGSEPWPVVFAWHWLNASSSSFVRQGELESATADMDFIAVVPDGLRRDDGEKAFLFSWPFAEQWGVPGEVLFFEDLLACVSEQFNVDQRRIYGIGVSAGGLWVSYLSTTLAANYFAAIESLSGGLGGVLGVWQLEWVPQPRKFPAIVLWGGPADWLGLSFEEASIRYRDALLDDGHFVVECVHGSGHGVPPIEAPEGVTRFQMLWRFMLDHPYDLPAGASPYHQAGLPDSFAEWCRVASPPPSP